MTLRWMGLVALLVGCTPRTWEGGGTAVGNPARTSVRPALAVTDGFAENSRLHVTRCDGSTAASEPVDADLVSGEGPELPGGRLCGIRFIHDGIVGELSVDPGVATLAAGGLVVDGGAFVLELGETDDDFAATSALFGELVEDGVVDPLERSRGTAAAGVDRVATEPAPLEALLLVGLDGARGLSFGPDFDPYVDRDPRNTSFRAAAWGDGTWVAVGGDGYTGVSAASTDGGLSWTPFEHPWTLNGVAFHDGTFVATTSQGFITVFDGDGWTDGNAPMLGYKDVAAGDTGFLAVAGTDVATSPDGRTWAISALPGVAGFGAQAATWGDGIWVAVGDAGYRVRSVDGTNWTDPTAATDALKAVSWNGAEFFAIGDGESWTSPDGTAWTAGPVKSLVDLTTFRGAWVGLDESGFVFGDPSADWLIYQDPPEAELYYGFASSRR